MFHHYHMMGQAQWDYLAHIAEQVGLSADEAVPPFVRELYDHTAQMRLQRPGSYRNMNFRVAPDGRWTVRG